MKVLVIAEDPTLDQYILKPIVDRLMADLGLKARVDVLWDPRLSGVAQALDRKIIREVVEQNPMEDLFLLMIDRDCDRTSSVAKARTVGSDHPDKLLVCLAVEEVEVWMLALHRGQLDARWSEVTSHCDPKEAYADPFLLEQRWTGEVGRGRKRAMRQLGAGWSGLLAVCPEIEALKAEIDAWRSRWPGARQPLP